MKIVAVETCTLSVKPHEPANQDLKSQTLRGIMERVLTGQQHVYSIQCHG